MLRSQVAIAYNFHHDFVGQSTKLCTDLLLSHSYLTLNQSIILHVLWTNQNNR